MKNKYVRFIVSLLSGVGLFFAIVLIGLGMLYWTIGTVFIICAGISISAIAHGVWDKLERRYGGEDGKS